MASYYKNVANMLGIELGEIFKINDTRNEYVAYYRFTTEGIEQAGNADDEEIYWNLSDSCLLNDLICGKTAKIIKLPQKPKNGEKYFVSDLLNSDLTHEYIWRDDEFDQNMHDRGLVFKTKEEAIKLSYNLLVTIKHIRKSDSIGDTCR